MNELEVLRHECDALDGPDAATIAAARAALRREIEGWDEPAPRRHRRLRLNRRLIAAAGIGVIAVAALTLVVSSGRSPVGVRMAAAAYAALNPPNGEIVHASSRTVVVYRSKVGGKTTRSSTSDDQKWMAGGAPPARIGRYAYPNGTVTTLTTACGQISYDSSANLFKVSLDPEPARILRSDPIAAYRDAYRHGHVHYRGRTTFRGIPAVKLVVTQFGAVSTMIVRKNNGYPLKTVMRRETARLVATYVTTYSTFEHLPRTPGSDRLPPHPGAFFVRYPPVGPTMAGCRNFGSLRSLTGGGTP